MIGLSCYLNTAKGSCEHNSQINFSDAFPLQKTRGSFWECVYSIILLFEYICPKLDSDMKTR